MGPTGSRLWVILIVKVVAIVWTRKLAIEEMCGWIDFLFLLFYFILYFSLVYPVILFTSQEILPYGQLYVLHHSSFGVYLTGMQVGPALCQRCSLAAQRDKGEMHQWFKVPPNPWVANKIADTSVWYYCRAIIKSRSRYGPSICYVPALLSRGLLLSEGPLLSEGMFLSQGPLLSEGPLFSGYMDHCFQRALAFRGDVSFKGAITFRVPWLFLSQGPMLSQRPLLSQGPLLSGCLDHCFQRGPCFRGTITFEWPGFLTVLCHPKSNWRAKTIHFLSSGK